MPAKFIRCPSGILGLNFLSGILLLVVQVPAIVLGSTPRDVGHRAAEWSLANQMTSLSYQNVCTAYGILKFAGASGDTELRRRLESIMRPYLLEGANPHRDNAKTQLAHRWFGFVPLELHRQTGNRSYRERGVQLANEQYANANADDMPAYTQRWYVDDIYGATTMQSLAYVCAQNEGYLERAVRQVLIYTERLQESNGLFYHGPESRFFWGRGNGWCAAAFAELLVVLPLSHPQRETILVRYRRMMDALLLHQNEQGQWRQLVDDPQSWPESSCSGMFLFALSEGARNGWLASDKFRPAIQKGWKALAAFVDEQGRLTEVCVGTGRGANRQFYLDRPRHVGDPHGQAALLWAAASLGKDPALVAEKLNP